MNILITGGKGTLGQKLLEYLSYTEHTIKILSKKHDSKSFDKSLISLLGDIINYESLKFATKNIDMVIHLAAITHTNNTKEYYDVNVAGTKNLIKACEKNGVKKILYISSCTANTKGGAYANSKYLAEQEIIKSSLDWIILRASEIYGTNSGAVDKIINQIKTKTFIPVLRGKQCRLSPIYIDDVINPIIYIVQKKVLTKKIYILAGPKEFTYVDMVDNIAKILHKNIIKIPISIGIIKIIAQISFYLKKKWLTKDQIPRLLINKNYNIEDAKKYINFNPKTLEQGVPLVINSPKVK